MSEILYGVCGKQLKTAKMKKINLIAFLLFLAVIAGFFVSFLLGYSVRYVHEQFKKNVPCDTIYVPASAEKKVNPSSVHPSIKKNKASEKKKSFDPKIQAVVDCAQKIQDLAYEVTMQRISSPSKPKKLEFDSVPAPRDFKEIFTKEENELMKQKALFTELAFSVSKKHWTEREKTAWELAWHKYRMTAYMPTKTTS